MAIPALMTTPYANAKPASSGRGARPAAPIQTQTALQIMSRLTNSDARPSPTITSGMQDVFRDLRAPQKDFSPASMMTPAGGYDANAGSYEPGSFGDQADKANRGIYAPGSFGETNAAANGTGVDPLTIMAGSAETRGFTGGRGDVAALNNGLDAWARGGAPAPAGKASGSGSAVDMMYGGLPAGPAAALKVDDMRTALAGARTQARDIDPVMTMLTPGMTPEQRNNTLSLAADRQRDTGVPPEMAADRMGYLNKLALRASGIPEAMGSARPVYQTTDASGRPVLSERQNGRTADGSRVLDVRPLASTATDVNRDMADAAAATTRDALVKANTPGLVDLGKDASGRPIQGIRQPGGKVTPLHSSEGYPRAIEAGGRKLIEVSNGKFTDEKGNPVEWRNDDRPLNVNEFLMSPALSDRFGGDYSKYREAHATATKAAAPDKPGAGGAAPAGEKPAAKVIYNHADVQAELVRRGLVKP